MSSAEVGLKFVFLLPRVVRLDSPSKRRDPVTWETSSCCLGGRPCSTPGLKGRRQGQSCRAGLCESQQHRVAGAAFTPGRWGLFVTWLIWKLALGAVCFCDRIQNREALLTDQLASHEQHYLGGWHDRAPRLQWELLAKTLACSILGGR